MLTESPIEFTLKVRNPGWAEGACGYASYTRVWSNDKLELEYDMPLRIHYPEHWEEDTVYTDMSKNNAGFHIALAQKVYHKAEEDNYFAITRGPITMGVDSRSGKAADSMFIPCRNAEVCEPEITEGVPCLLKLKFRPNGGEEYCLVDYASAGKDWETDIAAWLPMGNAKC